MLSPLKSLAFHKHTDTFFRWLVTLCGVIVLILIMAIAVELVRESLPAIKKFGLHFVISPTWDPVRQEFGALSSLYGTFASTLIAMAIAIPLSLGVALFLVELSPPFLSRIIGSGIELLAAVPSIIYGMWGLFVFAPFMADNVQPFLANFLGFLPLFAGPPMGIGILSAGIILAFMILPYMGSVMCDVFKLVPPVLKESAYGVGATQWEVARWVTIPYGIRGIIGALFLGLGRALGETMAVTFVIGNSHDIAFSLFAAGNSIASTLANEFSEASEEIYLSALMELGLILFLITLIFQLIAQMWLVRLRKRQGGGL